MSQWSGSLGHRALLICWAQMATLGAGAAAFSGADAKPPPVTLYESQPSGSFAANLAANCDVNGDGYGDVIVGATNETAKGQAHAGNVYVYYGSSVGLSATPGQTLAGNVANGYFGVVACAGDVNGDGYADVAVGAPGETADGHIRAGNVYIYYGSAIGLSSMPAVVLPGREDEARFGLAIAGAGDVNRDGYADIAVGAPHSGTGDPNLGHVDIFQGSATGLSTTPAIVLMAAQAGDGFGGTVASAGDINGDGYGDVVVPVRNETTAGSSSGTLHVYYGSPSGLSMGSAQVLAAPGALSVAAAGDVNADGYGDVIVGAFSEDVTDDNPPGAVRYSAGKVYLFHGSSAGLPTAPSLTLEGHQTSGLFGYQVSAAGDLNADGYADVLVGAPGISVHGQPGAGMVYVYTGSASGLSPVAARTLPGQTYTASSFGQALAATGDVNSDGFADFIVGSPGAGRADLVYGGWPDPPADVGVTPGVDKVRLHWTPSANATGYLVFMSITPGLERPPAALQVSGGGTGSATIRGLMNSPRYYFTIKALNDIGVSNPSTEVSSLVVLPQRPDAPVARRGNRTVTLLLNSQVNTDSYYLFQSSTSGGEAPPALRMVPSGTPGQVLYVTINGLTPGVPYFFVTKGRNAVGTGAPSDETRVVVGPPSPRTNVSAAPGNGEVYLNWSDSPDNRGIYYIFASTTPGGEAPPAVQAVRQPTATHATVGGLTNGTTYYFCVKTRDVTGTGPCSNEAAATPTAGGPGA